MDNTNSIKPVQENNPKGASSVPAMSFIIYFGATVLIAIIIVSIVIDFVPFCIRYLQRLFEQFSAL